MLNEHNIFGSNILNMKPHTIHMRYNTTHMDDNRNNNNNNIKNNNIIYQHILEQQTSRYKTTLLLYDNLLRSDSGLCSMLESSILLDYDIVMLLSINSIFNDMDWSTATVHKFDLILLYLQHIATTDYNIYDDNRLYMFVDISDILMQGTPTQLYNTYIHNNKPYITISAETNMVPTITRFF